MGEIAQLPFPRSSHVDATNSVWHKEHLHIARLDTAIITERAVTCGNCMPSPLLSRDREPQGILNSIQESGVTPVQLVGPNGPKCSNQPLSEYGFAYGLKTEMCQFSKNFSCELHGQGKKAVLV